MSLERLQQLISRFRTEVEAATPGAPRELPCPPQTLWELLDSMLRARYLDLAAHELRATGQGHYTICSTGHECNAVVGRLTRRAEGKPAPFVYTGVQIVSRRLFADVPAGSFSGYHVSLPGDATPGSHMLSFVRAGGATLSVPLVIGSPSSIALASAQTDISAGSNTAISAFVYDQGRPAANAAGRKYERQRRGWACPSAALRAGLRAR